jgi:hypothetical protein
MSEKLLFGPVAPIQSINFNWYFKTYTEIIDKFRYYPHIKFETEKHHILPKSLGGTNHKSNLVNLPYRYHFICHKLLAKIYGGKMWFALWIFVKRTATFMNSRDFRVIKKRICYSSK